MVAGLLQGIGIQHNDGTAAVICAYAILNAALPIPDKAVRALRDIIQKQCQIRIDLAVGLFLRLFLHQLIKVGEHREVLCTQKGNIRLPGNAEIPIQFNQTFFQHRPLHIRDGRDIEVEKNFQVFHMHGQLTELAIARLIHPIPLVPVQAVCLLLLLVITGRRTDLQGIYHTCRAAHSVNPVPVKIKA